MAGLPVDGRRWALRPRSLLGPGRSRAEDERNGSELAETPGWPPQATTNAMAVLLLPAETAHRDAAQFGHLAEGESEYPGGVEDGGIAGRQSIPGRLHDRRGQQFLAAGSDRSGQGIQSIRGVETPGAVTRFADSERAQLGADPGQQVTGGIGT